MSMPTANRAHYLDWARVLGMFAVFLFHSARFFDEGDWHVKSPVLSEGLNIWTIFLVQWIMPLMFVVSGVSAFYALRNRAGGSFMRDRVARLLVPLVAGIFTHIVFQVYLERLTHGQFNGSLIDFYPLYFNGLYLGVGGEGNFAWMGLHLWYLLILFLLSLMALPLFLYLKREDVRAWLAERLAIFERPGMIVLLAIPVAALGALTVALGLDLRAFGGWNPFLYLLFLIYGYLIGAVEPLAQAARKHGLMALIGGLATTGIGLVVVLGGIDPGLILGETLRALNSWLWMLAFIGLCARFLDFSNGFLVYAGEAVLPFYILHQTIILLVGWTIIEWPMEPLAKYLLIMAVSMPVIVAVYDLLIRRIAILRFLFGMKAKAPSRKMPSPAA